MIDQKPHKGGLAGGGAVQLANWSFSLSCTPEKKEKNKGADEKQMCLLAGGLIAHLCRPLPHAHSAGGKHIQRGRLEETQYKIATREKKRRNGR